jgi:hypothetical protein
VDKLVVETGGREESEIDEELAVKILEEDDSETLETLEEREDDNDFSAEDHFEKEYLGSAEKVSSEKSYDGQKDDLRNIESVMEGMEKEKKKWENVTASLYGTSLRLMKVSPRSSEKVADEIDAAILTLSGNITCFGISLLREWIVSSNRYDENDKRELLEKLKSVVQRTMDFYAELKEKTIAEEAGFSLVIKGIDSALQNL